MHTFEQDLARAGMGARIRETNRRGLAREPPLRVAGRADSIAHTDPLHGEAVPEGRTTPALVQRRK